MYDTAVVIGRFQPFHLGHKDLIDRARSLAKRVVVVLGSAKSPRTVKNPFTVEERAEMIRTTFYGKLRHGWEVEVTSVRDYLYNDALWVAELQERVRSMIPRTDSVILVGHDKDASSYYLKLFPNWHFEEHAADRTVLDTLTGKPETLSATHVRQSLFGGSTGWADHMPERAVDVVLHTFEDESLLHDLSTEYEYLKEYPSLWGKGPFVTTDAVAMCEGHVLLVERGQSPGKGLYALPGGFLNREERILDGALRELCEETLIDQTLDYTRAELKRYVVGSQVFDHPDRSQRGRTITHAYLLNLPLTGSGFLPPVGGADDAARAFWMPLADIFANEARFYEDHLHIIRHFVLKA